MRLRKQRVFRTTCWFSGATRTKLLSKNFLKMSENSSREKWRSNIFRITVIICSMQIQMAVGKASKNGSTNNKTDVFVAAVKHWTSANWVENLFWKFGLRVFSWALLRLKITVLLKCTFASCLRALESRRHLKYRERQSAWPLAIPCSRD